ncbi:MAG: hypothetical protein LBS99_05950 [Clostridiales bacterium]|jgi:hypothetical protein|nr:hypothetical protein [Clostridiales bacterium]
MKVMKTNGRFIKTVLAVFAAAVIAALVFFSAAKPYAVSAAGTAQDYDVFKCPVEKLPHLDGDVGEDEYAPFQKNSFSYSDCTAEGFGDVLRGGLAHEGHDTSITYYLTYTDDGLYFAAKVIDTTPVAYPMYNYAPHNYGDLIQLSLSFRSAFGTSNGFEDTFLFSLAPMGIRSGVNHKPFIYEHMVYKTAAQYLEDDYGTTIKSSILSDGYSVEVFFAWNMFGYNGVPSYFFKDGAFAKPEAGDSFRFGILGIDTVEFEASAKEDDEKYVVFSNFKTPEVLDNLNRLNYQGDLGTDAVIPPDGGDDPKPGDGGGSGDPPAATGCGSKSAAVLGGGLALLAAALFVKRSV